MALKKSRLAPTPSGLLHEGNALNFILTWWYIRFHSGELYLRIDDSDSSRVRDKYLENIFKVIEWLGIDYDSGPMSIEDHKKNFSQTHKTDYYFQELRSSMGNELFACVCSRKDLADSIGYPGTCLNLNLKHEPMLSALRCKLECPGEFEKMILWRKDNAPSYQLVSVLEDRDCGITDIIRGVDLLGSSNFQRDLFSYFSKVSFPKVFHHQLITDLDSSKLSKSQGSESVIEKFKTKEDFLERVLWPLLDIEYEGITLEELKVTPPEVSLFKEDS